jgi:hypothetical protein
MELSFLKDIWELAKSAGPFGTILLLYLYRQSDKERREAQSQLSAVSLAQTRAAVALESTLRARTESMKSMEAAIRAFTPPVPTRKRKGS